MAIERPKAIDDAPACGPQQREGRQAGEFLASRGMGAAQGKKLARRRCGIGDRGAAGLRPDQAIEEAVWKRRHQTATKQENWRPSFTKRNSARPAKQPRVHSRSAPSPKPTSRTPRDPTQDHGNPLASRRRRRLFQPERRPRPARRRPDDPSTPDHGPSSEPRYGVHDVRSWSMEAVAANGSYPRAMPCAG